MPPRMPLSMNNRMNFPRKSSHLVKVNLSYRKMFGNAASMNQAAA